MSKDHSVYNYSSQSCESGTDLRPKFKLSIVPFSIEYKNQCYTIKIKHSIGKLNFSNIEYDRLQTIEQHTCV